MRALKKESFHITVVSVILFRIIPNKSTKSLVAYLD